jgi:hypothetical protein
MYTRTSAKTVVAIGRSRSNFFNLKHNLIAEFSLEDVKNLERL